MENSKTSLGLRAFLASPGPGDASPAEPRRRTKFRSLLDKSSLPFRVKCVLVPFVSAAPSAPAAAFHPDPAGPAGAPPPTSLHRVFCVLRFLIAYGTRLTETLRQRAAIPMLPGMMPAFGPINLSMVLARIACGLKRAAMLEERLNREPSGAAPQEPEPAAPPRESRLRDTDALALPRVRPDPDDFTFLPSAARIAAEVRTRPIGAVILDICRDLGLTPQQCGREFWTELTEIVEAYGGDLSAWIGGLRQRVGRALKLLRVAGIVPPAVEAHAPAAAPESPPPGEHATGPPPPDFCAIAA